MMERAGKPADNLESEAMPERDGAFVGAHHKIRLHRLEAALAGTIEGMRTHRARYTPAGGPGSSYVAAVGDVRTAPLLVRLQEIGAENAGVLFRDEDFVLGSEPIVEGFLARHVSGQCVGFAGTNGGLQNRPNGVTVGERRGGADLHSSRSQ